MSVATSWIRPAAQIPGQDHLGTIAPGEAIYSELIPGVTNVTARPRYYAFFPWFLRELESRRPDTTADDFAPLLRRAECLFALAGIRHERVTGGRADAHAAAMVGREALEKVVTAEDDGAPIALAEHAAFEQSGLRYFQTRLGGFGQYYFGALREAGIVGGDARTRDIRYTNERGLPLAQAFARAVPGDRFFALLDEDVIALTDLDDLAAFCPCALENSRDERKLLIDIIVDPNGSLGDDGLARRRTFALALDLASKNVAPEYDFAGELRASTYAGTLFDGTTWTVPDALRPHLAAWATYARHELLSVAMQGLFWAALTAAEEAGRRKFRDAPDLARFAAEILVAALPEAWREETFGGLVRSSALPEVTAWSEHDHEMQAAWRLLDGDATPLTVSVDATTILLALARRSVAGDPYAGLPLEVSYFERYPINLGTFSRRARADWRAMPMKDVLAAWIVWCLRTHWRVAMQKLASGSPRDTFKVRPLEGAVQIVGAPAPTFSSPRIHRVVGFLRDLGFVEIHDKRPLLTKDGEKAREALLGG